MQSNYFNAIDRAFEKLAAQIQAEQLAAAILAAQQSVEVENE